MKREIIEKNLEAYLNKDIDCAGNNEIYDALLVMCKDLLDKAPIITGERKLYYISAEFLIGKLLSNNLINLGLYDDICEILKAHGKDMGDIEELENEPSLGNGGLGRLASCFLDSIANLGLCGDGVGLNYHFGLFRQIFENNKQMAVPNPWIEKKSWLKRSELTFTVPFYGFSIQSALYDIAVPGSDRGINRLRLFDVDCLDETIVGDGISFNKKDIIHNMTLFLYPDDSDEAGNLLRIYQQYFMVSNAAQLILYETKERGFSVRDLDKHVVIQINDTHPSMVIPELIRLLIENEGFTMDEAIETVSKTCAYTNLFPEGTAKPLYNTVDAALLFINAVYLYYKKTGDGAFVKSALPVMREIIEWYKKGTDFNIHMDDGGLIAAGGGLWQVTWMDVRWEDILPTPRHGKPVEINAYWYNALRVMGELDEKEGKQDEILAEKVKKSFLEKFWNEDRGCLNDVVTEGADGNLSVTANTQIRCNQIWALSLPFVMPNQRQAEKIIETVQIHLYTPWGLRSLSPEDADFHPAYGGSQYERDMAYHQGTVWAFPLGAYYVARLKFAENKAEEAKAVLSDMRAVTAAMAEGCRGQLAEVYDGMIPDTSKGCFAQGWSVGEILWAYKMAEDMLKK